MKRSQPRRIWDDARAKVEGEGACRVCRLTQHWPEAAHVTGRKHDQPRKPGAKTLYVKPESVVPMCAHCHRHYDAGQLDLLPYLHLSEQVQAVIDLLGIENARVRLSPSLYRAGRAA